MHAAQAAWLALAALLIVLVIALSGAAGGFLAKRAAASEMARLGARLAAAQVSEERVREMHRQLATLRHDLRGILSPAMLVADRLLDNPDPAVKRSGELVMRTVERMTARLAETRIGQDGDAPPTL